MFVKSQTLRKIREGMQAGKAEYQACKEAGISQKTLWVWANRCPRIERYRKALHERLYNKRVDMVADANFKSALSGNVTAQMFFLMNRDPDRWKDKRAVPSLTATAAAGIAISPVKALNDKELDDLAQTIIARRTIRQGTSG